MRSEIDKNISKILEKSNHNFAALFNHPKLVNEMFRKTRSTSWTRAGLNYRLNTSHVTGHNVSSIVNKDVK